MHRRALLSTLFLGGCASTTGGLPSLLRGEPLVAERSYDVPYVPTPDAVVAAMLDMAALRAGERLIDLGSGDGRIPIAAAKRGATATGIEIDGALVSSARYRAANQGVADRVRFLQQDLFDTSLRGADVVSLYLLPTINERLKPRLLTELAGGARVVSHAFDMGDWPPDEHRLVEDKHVYLWIVPAIAGGAWRLVHPDGRVAALQIDQRYSQVSGTLDGQAIADATLRGTALTFSVGAVRYAGLVGEAAIVADPAVAGTAPGWTARRT